jgi:hypothetical protein
VPRFTYAGPAEQVFPQYIDTAKGSTLVAVPGETYDIEQVPGLTVPGEPDEDGNPQLVELQLAMPPDGNWKPAASLKKTKENG